MDDPAAEAVEPAGHSASQPAHQSGLAPASASYDAAGIVTELSEGSLVRRRIAQGLRLFTLLAVASGVTVVALTAGRSTLSGLSGMRWHWLLATAALWLIAALVDGVRLAVLSRASEHPLTLGRSVSVIYYGEQKVLDSWSRCGVLDVLFLEVAANQLWSPLDASQT